MILVPTLRNYLQVILIVLLALFLFGFVHFLRGQVRNILQFRLFQLFLLQVSVTSSGFKKLEQPLHMNYATKFTCVSMYFNGKISAS